MLFQHGAFQVYRPLGIICITYGVYLLVNTFNTDEVNADRPSSALFLSRRLIVCCLRQVRAANRAVCRNGGVDVVTERATEGERDKRQGCRERKRESTTSCMPYVDVGIFLASIKPFVY